MAALQTLRNKAGVFIAAIIFIALLAFILTDLLGNGNNIFSDNDTIGKVDGEKIKVQDYQQEIEQQEEFYKMTQGQLSEDMQNQLRDGVWRQMVNDKIFEKVYDKAGIVVTGEEVLDMATGNHIAPVLRQFFSNPQTGIYDKAVAANFLQNKNSDARAVFVWNNIEQALVRERLSNKYMTLIEKSLYTTKNEKDAEKSLRSKSADVAFVGVRYTTIPDSLVSVSESEIKNLYNKSKENYKVDETRNIEYITFPIRPSEEDRMNTEKAVADMKADFESAEDAQAYAQMNAQNPAAAQYLKAEQLPSALASIAATANVGEVFGPSREGDAYKISKLVSKSQRPDSVKARHILIRQNESIADSLFNILVKNTNEFATIARKYSEDTGSAVNGGDLDWFTDGMMVPEFNEACFTNAKGAVVKVESQYGIHIINIQDKGVPTTKYNFATIDKVVEYSTKTHQNVYSEAQAFASKNTDAEKFNAAIDTLNLVKRYGNNIRSSAHNISTLRQAREVVKWAFGAKLNQVSELFEVGDEFVIAVLTKIQDKGYTPVSEVASVITNDILREKKSAYIAQQVAGQSLAQIAELYKTKVDSAHNVNYALNSVSGAGMEPALVGKISTASEGVQSDVVKGQNGAYIFSVQKFEETPTDDSTINTNSAQQAQALANYAYSVLVDVDVDDNRIKFY